MESAFFWSAATLYAASTVLSFAELAFHKGAAGRWATLAAVAGLVPHAGAIAMRWQQVGHGPFSSRYEVLSANAFLLVLLFLLSVGFARGLRGLGVFVMPLAFLMLGWAVSAYDVKQEVPIIFKSYWLWLHIGFAKLFGGSVLLATACALAYLLKASRPTLQRLPEAARLDLYSHQFLLLAFLFLGVMIVAGSLWAHQSWGRYWAWDPIETSALGTWIAYGVILHFRVLHRWSGRRTAYLTLLAFALMVLTLYVVVLVTPTIHNFYMVGRP